MPIENCWYIEGRVALTRLIGNITIEELSASVEQGTLLIDSGVAPVYSLVDMTKLEHFPSRLTEFMEIIHYGKSDKMRWIVVYGIPNRMANFFATMFAQLVRASFKVVNTHDEALELIERLEGAPLIPVVEE
jgi:hypothetical protein